jgi:hypothetical protein
MRAFHQGEVRMKFNRIFRVLLLCLFIAGLSQAGFAQRYEIYPYAGWTWPGKVNDFDIKNQAMWGVRGGVFVTDRIQLEGNFGYLNHFLYDNAHVSDVIVLNNVTVVTVREDSDPSNPIVTVTELDASSVTIVEPDPKQRAYQWDANFTYNFFENNLGKFAPYLTLGVGGTTVTRSDEQPSQVFIDQPDLTPVQFAALSHVVNQRVVDASALLPGQFNDGSYFTINYGGGLKAYRLWGPVGLRADLLGRSLPNFAGESLNGFQLTGGITFAWGER